MKTITASCAVVAAFVLVALPARAQQSAPAPTVCPVASGVELLQEVIPDSADGGPLIITIVRADPRVRGVRVESALGQDKVWGTDPTFGREIVSTLATRHGAVAGVNAGFFPFKGNPLGLHIQGGEIVTEPLRSRTSFYVDRDGKTGFAAFTYRGEVRAENGMTFALNGLNRQPDKSDALLLYAPLFQATTLRSSGRVEVVLHGIKAPLRAGQEYTATIAHVALDGGRTPLDKNTVVLSGGGAGADFLRANAPVGTKIHFTVGVTSLPDTPADVSQLREVVTGGPRLLTNGKVTINWQSEGMGQAFSTTRHPRTAVGRTREGILLFVTVDGRQKGLSRGVSLPELAQILLRYGATDAVNLDGGGSSSAVVWDTIVSSPSEGVERPVADALLLFADDLKPAARTPISNLSAPPDGLTVGDTYQFALPATNALPVWGTRGGVGFVSQTGLFHALRPGKAEVWATWGSRKRRVSTTFSIRGKSAGDAAGFAAALSLAADPAPAGATLVIRIANAEGDPLGNEPVSLTVTGGKADTATVTTNAKGEARVAVLWEVGATVRRVSVSSPARRFAPAELTIPVK